MRKAIFFLILFVTSWQLKAQLRPFMPKYYQPIDSSVIAQNQQNQAKEKTALIKKHPDRFSYAVTLGTGFSSFAKNHSMASSYIAPTINYQVNDKLFISVNGVIMQNNFNGFENNYIPVAGNSLNTNNSNYGINSQAFYQLNEKISIYGDATYFEHQTPLFSNSTPGIYNTDYKSVSLGVGYKVTDNLHFHFQYRYSDGLNPMYNSFSPFFNPNPYRSGYSIWDY
ncbi:MAG: hypothetical protein V2I54_11895 [Bacteroidales bacterium]|jgi:hypothetical protein|nr:hypothetical protein [Bacteroidales bacterium]